MSTRRVSVLAGGLHARSVPLAATVVVMTHLMVFMGWHAVVTVDLAWDQAPRGIGAPELVGVVLGAVLPAVLLPGIDQETMGGWRGRSVALALTAIGIGAVISLLLTWRAALWVFTDPGSTPPVRGLIGNLVLLAAIGWVCVLIVGRFAGQTLTVVTAISLVVAQQRWPSSPVGTHLASGEVWRTSWWMVVALIGLALAVTWWTRGRPLVWRAT